MYVQGLTQTKIIEIKKLINDNIVLCLTETQEKIRKVKMKEDIEVVDNMREIQDRKGGGIMYLHKKIKKIKMIKQESKMKDYLFIKVFMFGLHISLVVVYFFTNDKHRNKDLRKGVEEITRENIDGNLMILGDFNV